MFKQLHLSRFMTFMIVCKLVFAMHTCRMAMADEPIDQIMNAWSRHFEAATQNGNYHYKCNLVQRPNAAAEHTQNLKPELLKLDIEVFRLGNATRFEIRSHDSSMRWHEIYDGESKFAMNGSAHWSIYTKKALQTTHLAEICPIPDPLYDVLGLAFPTMGPLWQLRMDITHPLFDVPTALASGEFRVASQNEHAVELVNRQGDRLLLSVPHHYGIAARTWKVQAEELLVFSLKNDQWQTLENGMSFPAVSTLRCKRELKNEVLYTIEYKFTALEDPTAADFRVLIDTPGTDITFHGGVFARGGKDFRVRRVKEGETIDLTAVANGDTSIRWDAREWPPFTFWQAWNAVPLLFAMATIWSSLGSKRQFITKTKMRVLLQTVMLLAVVCIVLIHTAMIVYEGGTVDRAALDGYSWTHNFLSDLGRDCVCHTYRDNTPANHLFLLGMTLAGLSVGIYMWALPSLFTSQIARNCAVAASLFGMIAGWFFIRVGWEPIDRDFRAHQWYAMTALLSFAFAALACSVAVYAEAFLKNRGGFPLLALAALIVGYLLMRHFDDGRLLLGSEWLLRQAVAQKIVFYAILATMMLQVRQAIGRSRESDVRVS